jgi:CheY-like chemotaxis protein
MPQTDGFALVERMRLDAPAGSPVVMMLTSGDRPDDVVRCEELNIAAYLLKPIKQSELLDAIRLALGMTKPASPAEACPALEKCARPLRILLAEDSLVNQRLAVALLESQGHTVAVAANGKEAVAMAQSQPVDLVLMDVQMPEMDGLEATARIRARERQTGSHLPIIAMTAHALKGDRERCIAAGMDGYIAKPVRARELFETINATFGSNPMAEPCDPPPTEASNGPCIANDRRATIGSPAFQPPGGRLETIDHATIIRQPQSELIHWNEVLANLRGDEHLLRDVVAAALEETPRLLREIGEAVAAGNADRLRLAAHTLKGSLRCFGVTAAGDYAYQLELKGKQRIMSDVQDLFASLEREVGRVLSAMNDFVRTSHAVVGGPR